ncbi:MAG: EutN/CcmL family microcompartment protein [Planctomycetes bacterium]|nr:EutN/CcmL family microcompartment protein [Planctomycetota bacterium]
MILARVTGVVVAPQKNVELECQRLLVVHPIGLDGGFVGSSFLAVDRVDAGEGDHVLVNREGSGARLALGNDKTPVQAVVVAVVDRWDPQPAPPPLREPPHAAQA